MVYADYRIIEVSSKAPCRTSHLRPADTEILCISATIYEFSSMCLELVP